MKVETIRVLEVLTLTQGTQEVIAAAMTVKTGVATERLSINQKLVRNRNQQW